MACAAAAGRTALAPGQCGTLQTLQSAALTKCAEHRLTHLQKGTPEAQGTTARSRHHAAAAVVPTACSGQTPAVASWRATGPGLEHQGWVHLVILDEVCAEGFRVVAGVTTLFGLADPLLGRHRLALVGQALQQGAGIVGEAGEGAHAMFRSLRHSVWTKVSIADGKSSHNGGVTP